MNFRPLARRAPASSAGAIFRAHRVEAGLYVYQVAERLRLGRRGCRDLHAFEDGRTEADTWTLQRLYQAIGRQPPDALEPVPHLPRREAA